MSEIDKKTAERIDLYARVILLSEAPCTYRSAIRDLVRIYVDWDWQTSAEYQNVRMSYLVELLFRHGFDKTTVNIPVNADTAWALARRLIEVEKAHRAADKDDGK